MGELGPQNMPWTMRIEHRTCFWTRPDLLASLAGSWDPSSPTRCSALLRPYRHVGMVLWASGGYNELAGAWIGRRDDRFSSADHPRQEEKAIQDVR